MRDRARRALLSRLGGAALLALAASACSGTPEETAPSADAHLVGHVHGLGVDPADDALYVAGHFGLFRVTDGTPARVADRWQDTMGFTVAGPNTFLASGHPDLREDLPAHLGLIESTDSGRTWESVSLQGKADFHALEVAGSRLFAYDATSGRLMTTTDRRIWRTLATGGFLDLVAEASRPSRVFATTADQEVVEVTLRGKVRRVVDAPRISLLDFTGAGALVGVSADGDVFATEGRAGPWQRRGTVPGPPGALEVSGDTWHIATEEAVLSSADQGVTWDELIRLDQGR